MKRGTKIAITVTVVAGAGLLAWAATAKADKPVPTPKPKPNGKKDEPKPGPKRPSGSPPGPNCRLADDEPDPSWDDPYWSAEGPTIFRQMILDHFKSLGYSTPADRDTMNALGTDAKMGGGDDVANPEVSRFQGHYNAVSRHGSYEATGGLGFFPGPMGGLLVDGLVGPCTLNALKYVVTHDGNAQTWPAAVSAAASEGYQP